MSFVTSIRRRYVSLIISALLILVGSPLVWSARGADGWSQSALIEVGAAIALLGPLVFLEELLPGSVKQLSQLLKKSERSYVEVRSQLPTGVSERANWTRFSPP